MSSKVESVGEESGNPRAQMSLQLICPLCCALRNFETQHSSGRLWSEVVQPHGAPEGPGQAPLCLRLVTKQRTRCSDIVAPHGASHNRLQLVCSLRESSSYRIFTLLLCFSPETVNIDNIPKHPS